MTVSYLHGFETGTLDEEMKKNEPQIVHGKFSLKDYYNSHFGSDRISSPVAKYYREILEKHDKEMLRKAMKTKRREKPRDRKKAAWVKEEVFADEPSPIKHKEYSFGYSHANSYKVFLDSSMECFVYINAPSADEAIVAAKAMLPGRPIFGVMQQPIIVYDREEAKMPKMYTVKLYRRDSETTISFENVKHCWRDTRGWIMIAQYDNPPNPQHSYIGYPGEQISHYKLSRQN